MLQKGNLYYYCVDNTCVKKVNHVGCKKSPMTLFLQNYINSLVIPVVFFEMNIIESAEQEYENENIIIPITDSYSGKILALDLQGIKAIPNYLASYSYKTGSNFSSLHKINNDIKNSLFNKLIKITNLAHSNNPKNQNIKLNNLMKKIEKEINNFIAIE